MNELTTDTSTTNGLAIFNPGQMDALVRFSEMMAKSAITVPDHLRGKPSDCMAIAMQAAQWGMNPFAVAQKTHVVNGRLGYEAQLVNAVVQQCNAIVGAFHYEYQGQGEQLECRVGAVLRGETEITWGEWLRLSSVTVRNSPLWKTNQKQQLGYLQVKNWSRAYAPGAILGVYTPDELDVIPGGMTDIGQAQELPTGPRRKSESAQAPAPAPASTVIDNESGEILPAAAEAPAPAPAPAQARATSSGAISSGQVAYLRNKLKAAGVDEATVLDRFSVSGLELLATDQFDALKAELLSLA